MEPTAEQLRTFVAQADHAFKELQRALQTHRDFILSLGETVSELPEAVATQELVVVGQLKLDELQSRLSGLPGQIAEGVKAALDASTTTPAWTSAPAPDQFSRMEILPPPIFTPPPSAKLPWWKWFSRK